MALTNIGNTKTPSRPVEITFAAETGTPSDSQEILLVGHKAASGTAENYKVVEINNAGDRIAASGEVAEKFGDGTELAKMVLAAIEVNEGGSNFPNIRCVPLAPGDVDFGTDEKALVAAEKAKQEFIVSPYKGTDKGLTDKLILHAKKISGAFRVENNQFGTIGVAAETVQADPSLLEAYDTQFFSGCYLRDTGGHPRLVGEIAAMYAAKMAGNVVPFNPLNKITMTGLEAPVDGDDHITVGQSLESDAILEKGWSPLYVKPNGEVAIVRSVTARLSFDGSGVPLVTAYYDVQDFQVLYFWRKTVFTRGSQPDFANVKASAQKASDFRGELIRLMRLFEDQEMFQAVDQLSKKLQIERSSSDRHRFNVKTPVNVIPGLHVIATNVEATTEFDELTL